MIIEEDVMTRFGYPGHTERKTQHQALSQQLGSVASLDRIAANPAEFPTFFKNWRLNHINLGDRQQANRIREFLNR